MDSVLRDRLSLLAAVGCGVAIGVSGIYSFYRINRHFCDNISQLTNSIEDLKNEVYELRVSSSIASRAASHINSPITIHSHYQLHNSMTDDYLLSSPIGNEFNSVVDHANGDSISNRLDESTDENEEFYDFTEGEDTDTVVSDNHNDGHNNDHSDDHSDGQNTGDISLDEFLKTCDVLLEDLSTDKRQLYDKIKCAHEKYGKSDEILWRMTKATNLLGIAAHKEGNHELRKKLAYEALEYAKEALELNNMSAECNKWYAIAIGSLNDYVSVKEKIENGNTFRNHLDMALQLKPNDPTLHHMLGRWSFEIANLSWIERKVASTLFSKVPEVTYKDALNSFLNSYRLKPEWKENVLFIAKCFINDKMYKEANEWIDKGLNVKSKGEDDMIAHDDLKSLQRKYKNYR